MPTRTAKTRYGRSVAVHILRTYLYGTSWIFEGDFTCIDAQLSDDRQIGYGEYPNALERIAKSYFEQADDIWVTARVGHEFEVSETALHPGESHGALNRDDSTATLIVAGVSEGIVVPKSHQTIDLASICLQIPCPDEQAHEVISARTAGPAH